nr:hypothetical protein [Tanacetum cinerariifolium]
AEAEGVNAAGETLNAATLAVSTVSVQEASIAIAEIILFLLGVKRMKEGKMAFGKDFSNPLIGDSLLKTIWFSSHHALKVKSWLV